MPLSPRRLDCVRQARIKVAADESPAVYHCTTRTVNGQMLFDDTAKEVLRKQIWQVSDFCGVEIFTYTILDNHFHVQVRVPQREPVSDFELLRRFQVLYPHPTPHQAARLEVIRAELARNGPEAAVWRKRQLALMTDVSQFMKLLKQRFSIWFNKTHRRFGTLWAERFKSVLVESQDRILQTLGVYIDLNSVRAGLISDPKDYRFCGYAEAVAGGVRAQRGIQSITGGQRWPEAQCTYREMIFGAGAGPREAAGVINQTDLRHVIETGGRLPLASILRCRLRYFTDGAILGSRAFVALQMINYRSRTATLDPRGPQPLPTFTEWGDLATMRRLKRPAVILR
jgi:putative transposase